MIADITHYNSLFDFIADNPWWTFFIALITLQATVYIARYVAFTIRGSLPAEEKEDQDEVL